MPIRSITTRMIQEAVISAGFRHRIVGINSSLHNACVTLQDGYGYRYRIYVRQVDDSTAEVVDDGDSI